MLKKVILLAALLMTTGCSEFMVITKSAVREIGSDAINVERASYRPLPPPEQEKTAVARATPEQVAKARPADRKKGLWERQ